MVCVATFVSDSIKHMEDDADIKDWVWLSGENCASSDMDRREIRSYRQRYSFPGPQNLPINPLQPQQVGHDPCHNMTSWLLMASIMPNDDLDAMNKYSHGYQGFPFAHTDPLVDGQAGSPWEGQQNFHSEKGATESYDPIPVSRDSQAVAVFGIENRYCIDHPSVSWDTRELLERFLAQASRDVETPSASNRTVTPEHSIKAQSVELCPSLSQMSFPHSDSLPDNNQYPSSYNFADNQAYSELEIDEMDPSLGHGSFRSGNVKSASRRPSHILPVVPGTSYQPFTASADGVMFTSPMDVMPQAIFGPCISQDGISSAMELSINESILWDGIDQPGSGGSTPFCTDMPWSAGATTKDAISYAPNRTQSQRTRKTVVQHNGLIARHHSTNHHCRTSDVSEYFDSPHLADRGHSQGSADSDTPRDHALYQKAVTGPDGLYHCPWEGKDPSCNHKPEMLKCNYDKFVDSHLKPYRCKINACESPRFSSTACLLRHEREAHAMHGHGEKPFLCTFEGCDRGLPGNGFPKHWNVCDHMKRVHNRSPSPPIGTSKPQRETKKRKNSASETGSSKKSPGTGSGTADKLRAPTRTSSWNEQLQQGHKLLSELQAFPELDDAQAIEQKLQEITQHFELTSSVFHLTKSASKVERNKIS